MKRSLKRWSNSKDQFKKGKKEQETKFYRILLRNFCFLTKMITKNGIIKSTLNFSEYFSLNQETKLIKFCLLLKRKLSSRNL